MPNLKRNKLYLACCHVVLLSAAQQAALAEDSAPGSLVEEIIVEADSYKDSLQKALDRKRNSYNIVDAIIAEDVGKMPDENVAESLQRITGVSIARSNGEGTTVSIRGMGADLNRVTINGNTVTSGADGRGFSFDSLSADLLQAIEVVKSPSADHDEGSIGGSINLKTVRPLDLKKPVKQAEIQTRYNDYNSDDDLAGKISFANKFMDDRLGVSTIISYEERSIRTDTTQTFGWEINNINGVEGARPRAIVPRIELIDQERVGGTLGLQFQPDELSNLYLDISYSTLDTERQMQQVQSRYLTADATADWTINQNGTFTSGVFSRANQQWLAQENTIETENYLISLGGDRDFGDWNLSGKINYSTAEQIYPNFTRLNFFRFEAGQFLSLGYDLDGHPKTPNMTVGPAINDPSDPNFNSAILFQAFLDTRDVEDDETSGQFDLERTLDWQGIDSVKFGMKYRDRTKERAATTFQISVPPADRVLLSDHQTAQLADDFMSGENGSEGFSEWVSPDFDSVLAAVEPEGGFPFEDDKLQEFKVNEKSLAAYGMVTYGFFDNRLQGDAGIRFVTTDVNSDGFEDAVGGGFAPVGYENSYDNVLPSINMRYLLSDDMMVRFAAASVMARPKFNDISPFLTYSAGAGTGRSGNPELDPYEADQVDLSWEWYFDEGSLLAAGIFHKDIKTFIFNDIIMRQIPDGNGGFVEIADAGGTLFDIVTPSNGSGGRVTGLEMTYQQNFTFLPGFFSNFGMVLNYTYADSSASFISKETGVDVDMPFPEQSEHTANATLFWEKDGNSVRLAYNYRTDYLVTPFNVAGNVLWSDGYGQLDTSANFKLTENLMLTFQGVNLTNEIPYQYYSFLDEGDAISDSVPDDRLATYQQTGRIFRIGLRASF